MLDNLLKFAFRFTSVEPAYDESVCLAAGKSADVCSACRDVCPHEAITIGKRVEIDDIDCSGCGLCIQVCPSEALSSEVKLRPGEPLRCSQVQGSGQSVHCLGRLEPSDLLGLAGGSETVTLVHNDCSNCSIGTPAVLDELERNLAVAGSLAALHGRELRADLQQAETFRDDSAENRQLSRRQLLTGGWHGVRRGAADLLAPFDPGEDDDKSLPAEMQRRYSLIESAALAPDQPVPWVLPHVADACIMCPVCTNVCPTDAFEREFADNGSSLLKLAPERCLGCGICVSACPVGVITLSPEVTWKELSAGPQVVKERKAQNPGGQTIAR